MTRFRYIWWYLVLWGLKWPKYSRFSTFRQNSNNALFAQNTEKVPTFGLHIHVFMFSPIWSILGILDITCHGIDPFSALLVLLLMPWSRLHEDVKKAHFGYFLKYACSLLVHFCVTLFSGGVQKTPFYAKHVYWISLQSSVYPFALLHLFACPEIRAQKRSFWGGPQYWPFFSPFGGFAEMWKLRNIHFLALSDTAKHEYHLFGISRPEFTIYRQIWGVKMTHIESPWFRMRCDEGSD